MKQSILLSVLITMLSMHLVAQDTIPPDLYGEAYKRKASYRENKGQIIGTDGDPHNEVVYYSEGLWPQLFLKKNSSFSFQFAVEDADTTVLDTIYKIDVTCRGEGVHYRDPVGTVLKGDLQNFYLPWTQPNGAEQVQGFSRATYWEVWDGIDVQFYSGSGGEKVAFVIKPGADPGEIALEFDGQDSMKVDVEGNLKLFLDNKWVELREAVAYQYDEENNIIPVNWTASYDVDSDLLTFEFDQYDTDLPLVLLIGHLPFWEGEQSEGLCWSTYLGGGHAESVFGNASDNDGNEYVCGNTWSSFITYGAGVGTIYTPGGAKSPAMTLTHFLPNHELDWTDYFGGSDGYQAAYSVSIKPGAVPKIYVGGETFTTNMYPQANGIAYYDPTNSSATFKGFLARFSDLGVLEWSTYFGDQNTSVLGITHDANGRLIITGVTQGDLPTNQGGDPSPPGASYYTYQAGWDAFITMFNANDRIIWSTFYGGEGADHPKEVRANDDFIVMAGYTTSEDIALQSGGANSYTEGWHSGVTDVFLAEFDMNGAIQWATYFGGSGTDDIGPHGLDIHPSSNAVYLAGNTSSADLEIIPGSNWYDDTPAANDVFLAHFSGLDRSRLLVSFVSGDGGSYFYSVRVDKDGRFVAAGVTPDQAFPYQPVAGLYSTNVMYDDEFNGLSDGMLIRLDDDHNLLWSTYFGGEAGASGEGIMSLSLSENLIYAAGQTSKNANIFTFFPLFDPGAPAWYDEEFNSPNLLDGFVTAFCVDQHTVGVEEDPSPGISVFDDQQGSLVLSHLPSGTHTVELFDAVGRSIIRFNAVGGDRVITRHSFGSVSGGAYLVVVDGVGVGKILHMR